MFLISYIINKVYANGSSDNCHYRRVGEEKLCIYSADLWQTLARHILALKFLVCYPEHVFYKNKEN